jgi:GntR family transcriptional regulator
MVPMEDDELGAAVNAFIDRQTAGVPAYQTVRLRLRADLDNGRWKPGDMLPTEAELARHFGLSVGTIRQAILELVREGLLTRRPGSGTFVARLDASRGFGRFFRFRDDLRGAVEPRVRHVDTILAPEDAPGIAARLGLDSEAPLYRVRRMMLANDEPICLYVSYLDPKQTPGLDKIDFEDQRLYAMLERTYGTHVLRAEEILRAGTPTDDEARILGIAAPTPVILMERTAFGERDTVVEWRRTVGRSDQFYYKIQLP